ncbi:MAG: hypothetical protein K8R54_12020 [Bacteroidales bacterium]|nr:hypothetical protein [Bacteroidales bacterium]
MSNIFPTDTVNSSLRMHNKGNYWFFYRETFPHDFPLMYNELIKNASNYIEIFDPYFNLSVNDQDVFNDIQDDLTIKLLTLKGLTGSTYLPDVLDAMKIKISSSKDVRFGMRVINKGDMNEKEKYSFHDRFLIIDQTNVYLIGSSIGHHLSPKQSTGIYKVDNTDTKEFIKEIFDEYWKKAMNNEIPIQFL